MKHVRALRAFLDGTTTVRRGETLEVSDQRAADLERRGLAVPVETKMESPPRNKMDTPSANKGAPVSGDGDDGAEKRGGK